MVRPEWRGGFWGLITDHDRRAWGGGAYGVLGEWRAKRVLSVVGE